MNRPFKYRQPNPNENKVAMNPVERKVSKAVRSAAAMPERCTRVIRPQAEVDPRVRKMPKPKVAMTVGLMRRKDMPVPHGSDERWVWRTG